MKNQIQILGTYKLDNKTDSFTGTITFDERENSIYYSWTINNKGGQLIAGKSQAIAFGQIPVGHDRLEFSKSHALDGIKNYRIGREKLVTELNVG